MRLKIIRIFAISTSHPDLAVNILNFQSDQVLAPGATYHVLHDIAQALLYDLPLCYDKVKAPERSSSPDRRKA